MPKYIEAARAATIIAEKRGIPIVELVDTFAKIPAADVAPVAHGRWINRCIAGEDPYECSCCGNSVDVHGYHYCPNCGAKMDGGKHE